MRIYRHPKTDVIYLDFVANDKRYRRSTKLPYSAANWKIVEKDLAPTIAASIAKGTFEIDTKVDAYTVDIFAKDYFQIYKTEVSPRTYHNMMLYYKNHIKPTFGNMLIKNIKPMTIEKWQLTLLDKYKYVTVRKYRLPLVLILKKAFQNQLIDKNPMDYVTLKAKQQNHTEEYTGNINPFSTKDINKLLNNSTGWIHNFIALMYGSGMRPSEIVALTWDDIDFENRTIKINKAAITKGEISTPKTKASIRTIDMLQLPYDTLKDQQKITRKYKQDRIFLTMFNTPLSCFGTMSHNFTRLKKEVGIKQGSLYNLRHTFASTMISKGADILWVSKTLGHNDLGITLKVYAKFMTRSNKKRKEDIEKYGKYLA